MSTDSSETPMTDEHYVAHLGDICPNCRSREIEAIYFSEYQPADKFECLECHATWWHKFTLIGYAELELFVPEPLEDDDIFRTGGLRAAA
jgi:hypothetical protein